MKTVSPKEVAEKMDNDAVEIFQNALKPYFKALWPCCESADLLIHLSLMWTDEWTVEET